MLPTSISFAVIFGIWAEQESCSVEAGAGCGLRGNTIPLPPWHSPNSNDGFVCSANPFWLSFAARRNFNSNFHPEGRNTESFGCWVERSPDFSHWHPVCHQDRKIFCLDSMEIMETQSSLRLYWGFGLHSPVCEVFSLRKGQNYSDWYLECERTVPRHGWFAVS